jgi:integrase
MRRGELLALRWSDFDKKEIQIRRALEQTNKFALRLKLPKTKCGKHDIGLDADIIAELRNERERHLRLATDVPEGAEVDLSLIKLPAKALEFPAAPEPGEKMDFAAFRNPRNFSKEFARRADLLGFGRIRFHDLRGIHATGMLDAGIPIDSVARRIGDDPAVLLRNYNKRQRTEEAQMKMADAIANFSAGFLGKSEFGPYFGPRNI